jgi:hypothetical protein
MQRDIPEVFEAYFGKQGSLLLFSSFRFGPSLHLPLLGINCPAYSLKKKSPDWKRAITVKGKTAGCIYDAKTYSCKVCSCFPLMTSLDCFAYRH